MKKYLCLLLISFLILPLNVFAQSYSLKDLSISVDDSTWYVFTRNNISENPELDELGISYDYLNNLMNSNDVYLDAVQFKEDDISNLLELFVVIKKVDNVSNLHVYGDSEINELGELLKEKVGADSFNAYSVGNYKYIYVNYYDSKNSYYIDEYYTVINGYGYTIMAQKTNLFSSVEKNEIKEIVNSSSYKSNPYYEKKPTNDSLWENVVVAAVTGAICGALYELFNRSMKKRRQQKNKTKEINQNEESKKSE